MAYMKDPLELTEERYVLRVKSGDQEWSRMPCSCSDAMIQSNSWIKCIHCGVDPDEACFQNYLMYNLAPESTLSRVVVDVEDRMKSRNLVGLILVHHSDSTMLLDEFWDIDLPANFLLCVVSHRLGQPFLDWLQKQKPGEVYVTVDVESSVDVPNVTAKEPSTAETADAEQSSRWWPLFWRKVGFSLSKGLKAILDESTHGLIDVAEVYGRVFLHFQSFEKDESRTDLDKGLKLLRERLNNCSLIHEYLLHLAIVYRTLSHQLYRNNDHCFEYAWEFLKKTEEFLQNPVQLAVDIKNFVSKGDFEVPYSSTQSISFYAMMSLASQRLLIAARRRYPAGHFGLKILFVYIDLKFNCLRTESGGVLLERWKSFIAAEKYGKAPITQEELKGIGAAIQLGMKLNLPPRMRFSGFDLADMVVDHGKQRYFTQLTALMDSMAGTLFQDKAQLVKFLCHSHTVCFVSHMNANKCLRSLSTSKDIAKILKEGVQFLSTAASCFEDSSSTEQDSPIIFSLCLWWGSMIGATLLTEPDAMCAAVKDLATELKGDRQQLRSRIKSGLNDKFKTKVEEDMKAMDLSQFVVYLKSLPIIRMELVKEYLEGYQSKRCRVVAPLSGDFSQLLQIFFKKWPKCESAYHKMFVDVIKASADIYRDNTTFIPAVLSLETGHLLSDRNVDDKEIADLMEMKRDLGQYVVTYIQKKRLAGVHTARWFQEFVCERETFTPLQEVVLSVLAKFVIIQKVHLSQLSRVKAPQEVETLRIVLSKLCAHYKEVTSWDTPLTVSFSWYWEILAKTCLLVKPDIGSLDLSWCRDSHMAVSLLAQVYSVYSKVFSVTSLQSVPDVVERCKNDHMRKYFQWVQEIQQFIRSWEQKIINGDWTEEEILDYANMAIPLHKIALSLHIEALEVSLDTGLQMKTDMQALKPSVKDTLIRIDSVGRRCSVLGVLHSYNVAIPKVVIDLLDSTVENYESRLLQTIHFVEEEKRDIKFHSVRMKDLKALDEKLHQFLTPIVYLIDFLVHFSMHKSHMFSQYLQERLQAQQSSDSKVPAAPSKASVASTLFAGMEDVLAIPDQESTAEHPEGSRQTMDRFLQALRDTESFLKSILLGEATYGSLCSLGCFQEVIGAVNVTYELDVLQSFRFPGIDQHKDMRGIKSILDLIQFADYIDNIHGVCEQYHMTGCLDHPGMTRLLEIHSILVSKEGKTELNAIKSEEHLAEIRQILDLTDENWHALGIFAVVKDSADFYQFLQEKNFKGKEGASFFMQQHTLITSHLQHEEYNEQVLNHVLVAIRYVSPFLDTEQTLPQLMKEVYRSCRQQAVKGESTDFVQLHTVNKNVHLVRLWFSRAEECKLEVGSTVELEYPRGYGTIRWIGRIPGLVPDIAGVEMDREMDGCGDGCWKNERYFTCERGHAIFTVLSKLRPDQWPRQGFSPGSKSTRQMSCSCKCQLVKDQVAEIKANVHCHNDQIAAVEEQVVQCHVDNVRNIDVQLNKHSRQVREELATVRTQVVHSHKDSVKEIGVQLNEQNRQVRDELETVRAQVVRSHKDSNAQLSEHKRQVTEELATVRAQVVCSRKDSVKEIDVQLSKHKRQMTEELATVKAQIIRSCKDSDVQLSEHKIQVTEELATVRAQVVSSHKDSVKEIDVQLSEHERKVTEELAVVKEQIATCEDALLARVVSCEEALQTTLVSCEEAFQERLVSCEEALQAKDQQIEELQHEITGLREERLQRETELASRLSSIEANMKDIQPPWAISEAELEVTTTELGKGAYGEVRVGVYHGDRVAVKRLHKIIASDYYREMIQREMKIAARLRHPKLVLFIGAITTGNLTIVTELMETSLRSELEHGRLKEAHLLPISRDVACALCYLHSLPEPIIHRDISSANVLLNSRQGGWTAKVGDYGSANFQAMLKTVGPGCFAYAAPEASRPEEQGPKMDVYSYGVLLLEMCSGTLPDPRNLPALQQTVHTWGQPKRQLGVLACQCTHKSSDIRPHMRAVVTQLDEM